jgi:hypothetical protein
VRSMQGVTEPAHHRMLTAARGPRGCRPLSPSQAQAQAQAQARAQAQAQARAQAQALARHASPTAPLTYGGMRKG